MNNLSEKSSKAHIYRFGFYIAIIVSVLTFITWAFAMFAIPVSGPYCLENCIEYPYNDIIDQFPHDYIWMYFAILLNLVFVMFMVCIHHMSSNNKKIFSHSGLLFAVSSAIILILDYFIQVTIIQPSVVNGEFEGIALWTQFNGHGLFIAMEEIGFILMNLALFIIFPVFSRKSKLENSIRWILIAGFVLMIASLVGYSIIYGIHREYRFEVAIITINWLVLIVIGILISRVFITRLKTEKTD